MDNQNQNNSSENQTINIQIPNPQNIANKRSLTQLAQFTPKKK
jgi:hypothetical protein